MKKEIIYNDYKLCRVKYIISKKKCAIYNINKLNNKRSLKFYKLGKAHRPCNNGAASIELKEIRYMENGELHNLYFPAYIDKEYMELNAYYIYGKYYNLEDFLKYILIYDNLSYKRNY